MADAVYAIEDFPHDDLLWRIEWIGGVGYNTSVPSDPQIEICLAQLPAGETNPLSARSRSSQTKRTVRIAVGLLPYICFGMAAASTPGICQKLLNGFANSSRPVICPCFQFTWEHFSSRTLEEPPRNRSGLRSKLQIISRWLSFRSCGNI